MGSSDFSPFLNFYIDRVLALGLATMAPPNTPAKVAAKAESNPPDKTRDDQKILPGSAAELHEMANDAVRRGDDDKAAHLYTMAIDAATRGMKRDENGCATDADLLKQNKTSEGRLAKLLANRSLVYLKKQDLPAALTDAETCVRAEPGYEKGQVRLLAALEASGVSLPRQLEACEKGLEACPGSELITKWKWRVKKALAAQPTVDKADAASRENDLETAQRLVDDANDPRHAMACADLGSVFAVGAHGMAKDVVKAEKLLRIAAKAGEVSAQRNLGLLLLELQRPAEAMEVLTEAVANGDDHAEKIVQQLAEEAKVKQAEMFEKLEGMAARGDARAAKILQEMRAEQ